MDTEWKSFKGSTICAFINCEGDGLCNARWIPAPGVRCPKCKGETERIDCNGGSAYICYSCDLISVEWSRSDP